MQKTGPVNTTVFTQICAKNTKSTLRGRNADNKDRPNHVVVFVALSSQSQTAHMEQLITQSIQQAAQQQRTSQSHQSVSEPNLAQELPYEVRFFGKPCDEACSPSARTHARTRTHHTFTRPRRLDALHSLTHVHLDYLGPCSQQRCTAAERVSKQNNDARGK